MRSNSKAVSNAEAVGEVSIGLGAFLMPLTIRLTDLANEAAVHSANRQLTASRNPGVEAQ